jgi:hypothetical protein
MNLSRTAMLTGCTIIAALCALTLSSFAAETAFGTAPELDCGTARRISMTDGLSDRPNNRA